MRGGFYDRHGISTLRRSLPGCPDSDLLLALLHPSCRALADASGTAAYGGKVRPARVDADKWPDAHTPKDRPFDLFRSRDFVVALYRDGGHIRMTVNRTMINRAREWLEGISWDELMELKRYIGFGESYAVEVFPRDSDIVNVAAMRHLWILPEPLDIGWFRKPRVQPPSGEPK